VISVPALFELPQTAATSEAARLAGFDHVELLQEPVASALAAGWSADEDASGAWLVYDLGGGTFDVSLLETREGLLRIVGHDGDNFLGGRDLDQSLVRWVLDRMRSDGHDVDPADPAHAVALRVLAAAAEDAKIDLSRGERAVISLPALFSLGGAEVDVDVTVDRGTLEALAAPWVDRTIAVCRRLLAAHGLAAGGLHRVVLVGGPTVMPALRERVQAALGAPFAEGFDPMALVARGAAIHAATAGLSARPRAAASTAGRRLWLEYPSMSPDPTPFVLGRVLDGSEPAPTEVRFVRQDDVATDWTAVRPDGTLMTMVELVPRMPNTFRVQGRDAERRPVAVLPESITIVAGRTLGDPPLSRSVGVALADDTVRTYLERGTMLPAKRTHVHRTLHGVRAGSDGVVLSIPVVQGEHAKAHLCRLVGRLELSGRDLRADLPANADVEVTLEVDRGGRLTARALVSKLGQAFEQVADLAIPHADPEALGRHLGALAERLQVVRGRIGPDPVYTDRLLDVEWALQDARAAIAEGRGGDADAAQRAQRLLVDADAALDQVEQATRTMVLDRELQQALTAASAWVSRLGTPTEQQALAELGAGVGQVRASRDPEALERQLVTVRQLASAAYFRHPEAWRWEFEHASARLDRSTDLVAAKGLVERGRQALAAGDTAGVRDATLGLHHLLPPDDVARAVGYRSDVR
jgi:molecular chaperone DnaK